MESFGPTSIYGLIIYTNGFKIRSKDDAKAFFKMKKGSHVEASDGDFYWDDGKHDYYLRVKGNGRDVFSRPVFERGNIFSPYFQEQDPVTVIWNTRKYINRKFFSDQY